MQYNGEKIPIAPRHQFFTKFIKIEKISIATGHQSDKCLLHIKDDIGKKKKRATDRSGNVMDELENELNREIVDFDILG